MDKPRCVLTADRPYGHGQLPGPVLTVLNIYLLVARVNHNLHGHRPCIYVAAQC